MRSVLLVIGVTVGACSSSGITSSSTQAKRVIELSPQEQQSLCDWSAQLYGGYGHSQGCPDAQGESTAIGPTDQATCASELSELFSQIPNCQATAAVRIMHAVARGQSLYRWRRSSGGL